MSDIVERLKTTRFLSQRNQMALQTDAANEIVSLRRALRQFLAEADAGHVTLETDRLARAALATEQTP